MPLIIPLCRIIQAPIHSRFSFKFQANATRRRSLRQKLNKSRVEKPMTSTKNLHPNVDEPKNSGLLYKSASCPAMMSKAVEESDMIPPLTQSHSSLFPSQHEQTHVFYQNEISQLQACMTPQFCSYFFPMPMIPNETDIQKSSKDNFSTAQNAAAAMRHICNVCGCPITRECSLPQPCNQPPKYLQYMTGYYYYPYGNWFCGPYHVKGACMPGRPWQPTSSCGPERPGPCGPSPPSPCTICKPCMCNACYFIPELPRNKPINSLTRLFKSCGPCSTSNPFVFCGPCYKPCYGSYFPRRLCSPCKPRKPSGVCGPCGPCRPSIPNRTCGPCACLLPRSCGPCGRYCGPDTPPTPSKPYGPNRPCCCSPCSPCGCVTCGIAPWFGPCINCSITPFPVNGLISEGANVPVASAGPNGIYTKSDLVPDMSVVQNNFKPTRCCPICSTTKAVPSENIPGCPVNLIPRPLPSTPLSRLSQTHSINPNLVRNYPFNKPKPILYKRTMSITNMVFAYFFSTNASIPKNSYECYQRENTKNLI